MNKSPVTLQELMDDASACFILNLKNTGAWKIEISRNSQIIALTTQLTELKTSLLLPKVLKALPNSILQNLMMANTLVVLPSMPLTFGVLKRLITKLSTTWLNVTARPGIGVISTSTITKVLLRMECM
jgi:hypothetical protein